MDISGKIIAVLDPQTGTGRNGEWKKQDFVLEIYDGKQGSTYPSRICFNIWGADKLSQYNIQVGQEVTVSLDFSAHEYNNRWFNDVRAWRVTPGANQGGMTQPMAPGASPAEPFSAAPAAPVANGETQTPAAGNDESSDLPF